MDGFGGDLGGDFLFGLNNFECEGRGCTGRTGLLYVKDSNVKVSPPMPDASGAGASYIKAYPP